MAAKKPAPKKTSDDKGWYSRLDEPWRKALANNQKKKQGSVTDVYIDDESAVTSLAPLEAFPKIREINCDAKKITDLSPLAKLPNLESLRITSPIRDFSPLARMTRLKALELNDTSIADLSPIAGLAKLERLELDDTQVSDLSPIAGLAKLERLQIARTKVRDLSPIVGLKRLHDLVVRGCAIESFDLLAKIPDLQTLDVSETAIESLEPIYGKKGVYILHVRETKVGFGELLRYKEHRGDEKDAFIGLSLHGDFDEHDAFLRALESADSKGVEKSLTAWINNVLIQTIKDPDEAHLAPKLLERWFALDVAANVYTKELAGNALHVIVTQNVDPSLEKRVLETLVPQAEMDRRLAFNLACYHAKRGNKSEVLRYARTALEKGQEAASFRTDKDFEALRGDDEFEAVIATNFTPDPYTSPMAWWNGLPEELRECFYWDEEEGEKGLVAMLAEPIDMLQLDGVRSMDPLRGLRVKRLLNRECKTSSMEIVGTFRDLEEIDWEKNEYLGGTQLTDLSPIANVTSLRVLKMPGHLFTNLDAVARLENLEELNVRGSPIESIEGVRGLVKLTDLALDSAKPIDLSALEGLEALEDLWIHGSVISFESIAKLKSLRRFWIQELALPDGSPVPLAPLYGLKKLEQIWVGKDREAAAKKELKKVLPKCKVS